MKNHKNLLLISNSTMAGEPYMDWCKELLAQFYKEAGVKKVLFIPYAGVNLSPESLTVSFDVYEKRVASVMAPYGVEIESIHRFANPVIAVKNAEAIAVGGGNTFHLFYMLHDLNLMEVIRQQVMDGLPYAGWSAGANLACPTLMTTNDMPIIQPQSFNGLNLIPFQINPHYLDAHPSNHGGETRQQRIEEFLTVNRRTIVAGLREGCYLRCIGEEIFLHGKLNLRVFKYGQEPFEIEPEKGIINL